MAIAMYIYVTFGGVHNRSGCRKFFVGFGEHTRCTFVSVYWSKLMIVVANTATVCLLLTATFRSSALHVAQLLGMVQSRLLCFVMNYKYCQQISVHNIEWFRKNLFGILALMNYIFDISVALGGLEISILLGWLHLRAIAAVLPTASGACTLSVFEKITFFCWLFGFGFNVRCSVVSFAFIFSGSCG